MLKASSAPFLFTLLISVLGWYVGKIDSDIRGNKVAIYWVERGDQPNSATAYVENVSRTASLGHFAFALICEGTVNPANTPHNRRQLVERAPISPIDPSLSNQQPGQAQSGQVSLETGLAPGGLVGLSATLADCSGSLQFLYRPNPAEPFLMVEAGSLNGLMLRHYSNFTLIVFVLLLIAFAVWMGLAIFQWWRTRNVVESVEPEEAYSVRVSVVPADAGPDGPAEPDDKNKRGGKRG